MTEGSVFLFDCATATTIALASRSVQVEALGRP